MFRKNSLLKLLFSGFTFYVGEGGAGGAAVGGNAGGGGSSAGGGSAVVTAAAGTGNSHGGAGTASGVQTGAAGAQAGAGAGTGTANSGAVPTADWTSSFNEDSKGYATNKGWKDPSQLLDSYRNLEKLQGVPQEQLLKLPKSDEPDTAWDSIYKRLGRPDTAEGYKLEVPKGQDPAFSKQASEWFHKLGLSEKQGQNLTKMWNEYQANQGTAGKEAFNAQIHQQAANLKKEWGAAHEQNVAIAKRAAREFGVDAKTLDALDAAKGHDFTMKLLHSMGSKMGEATFHAGNGGAADSNGPLTPAQAQAQIKALKGDPGFSKKYIEGDHGARAKMERLHQFAYPEA